MLEGWGPAGALPWATFLLRAAERHRWLGNMTLYIQPSSFKKKSRWGFARGSHGGRPAPPWQRLGPGLRP